MNFPNEQLCAHINGNKRVQAFLDGQAQVENLFRAGSFHESAYVKYCLFLTHIPLNHSDFLYAICVYGVEFHALEPYKLCVNISCYEAHLYTNSTPGGTLW